MISEFFNITEQNIEISYGYVLMGDDLVVLIGGGKEHIGAVGISIPRPSLKYKNKISSSTSVFTRTSHKEDEVVKRLGDKIAAETNRFTTVIAGIHFDNITEEKIKQILEMCYKIADKIISSVKEL